MWTRVFDAPGERVARAGDGRRRVVRARMMGKGRMENYIVYDRAAVRLRALAA